MGRTILGWAILLHALAHVSAGAWAPLHDPAWLSTVLWTLAFAGYFAVGLAVLRAPLLRRHWKGLLIVASLSSLALIVWTRPSWGMIGVAFDVIIFLATIDVIQPRIDADIEVDEILGARAAYRHPRWVELGWTIGAACLLYGTAVLLLHPVLLRWGTTPADRTVELPGDDVLPSDALYRIDHAITINAPASAVWPWLVQLGQDRAGFYSYAWLERSIGDDIRNADYIDPAWQQRAVGDTILATQRDYLGGHLGTIGWRVNALEPNRVLGLENWGNFILQPIDSASTRLIVRTRGATRVTWTGFLLAPVNVFVFEPAHFIMQRAMLRGIRDRAERAPRGRAARA